LSNYTIRVSAAGYATRQWKSNLTLLTELYPERGVIMDVSMNASVAASVNTIGGRIEWRG
jgi:hypothetical protein